MGILLSRFRAVIFPRAGRMKSGGLASEPVIAAVENEDGRLHDHKNEDHEAKEPIDRDGERMYYGLHWRKELNWRALGFEFVEDEEATEKPIGNVDFHA